MEFKVLLLLDFSEEYSKSLLKGLKAYAKDSADRWVFCSMPLYHRETIGMSGILKWAGNWGANGIIGQLYNNPSDVDKLLSSGIPVIAQDFKERFDLVTNITGSYFKTGEMAADYFIKKGFCHFGFYGFENIVWSRERAEGFESRLHEFGYSVHYFTDNKEPSEDFWFYKPVALYAWLRSLPKPISILACDDRLAQHITEGCRFLNIRVPEDVSVLGVDNDDMICALSDPPLSSIALNVERGGYDTAKTMEKMIVNGINKTDDIYVDPVRVVTRQSTDIYATSDALITTSLKYIHDNIDKKMQVRDVMKQVPLSRRVFEKRFLESTGQTIYKYITTLRMEKFAENIVQTNCSINQIALELGFEDTKNISRQFKLVYACSPNEFRKRYTIKRHSY
ncbi:DNA-binding transcriptional regulator [Parafilimonas sp.]|uniref:DNA-binding transcriptional regulator n=1 Tax=Parafilimonas sp. TaxID=1969739 RepID=UPI0039E36F33